MPLLTYSLLRLGLFAVCFAGLLLAGMGSWLAVLLAAFLAWGLSYVLLAKPRDAAALFIAERAERARARGGRPGLSAHAQEDADAEDAAVDAGLGARPTGPDAGATTRSTDPA